VQFQHTMPKQTLRLLILVQSKYDTCGTGNMEPVSCIKYRTSTWAYTGFALLMDEWTRKPLILLQAPPLVPVLRSPHSLSTRSISHPTSGAPHVRVVCSAQAVCACRFASVVNQGSAIADELTSFTKYHSAQCHVNTVVKYIFDAKHKKLLERYSDVGDPNAPRVMLYTEQAPHTSHLTPHTSHLTPHTSHLTPHTSHLTPHTRSLPCSAAPSSL
jgi:hypothetical protein